MSHVQQRTLTLTEELEKLEQSITLTLQGMDTGHCSLQYTPPFRKQTKTNRNRPQFQPGTSYRHLEHSTYRRAVRKSLKRRVGRVKSMPIVKYLQNATM